MRPRTERDRDRERNRGGEEEELRRHGKIKGRHDDDFIDEDLLTEEIDVESSGSTDDGGSGVRMVYAPIPNRKRGSGASAAARKREMRKSEPINPTKASKKVVRIDDSITVNDLAGELSVKVGAVVKTLMQLGMMASVNQPLDFETATIVCQEFGFESQNTTVSIGDILAKKSGDTSAEPEVQRAPVVTVMGHVDHGKTSLLDAIRQASVAVGEAGGITQHIGAYQVVCNEQRITFLDTPGHEAFTAMRARGAQITDIVILVVAADDGVMPQTIEAINHAKSANVPIIVAINKIDKPNINIERIQGELAQYGVTSEEWGGENMFVQVSAKTRKGIDSLLESVLLQAEVLELKARIAVPASGVVVEAKLDKSRGPIATLLVTQGSLRVSDWIVAGTSYGRVRAMFNDKGERLEVAEPATPVEILGLDKVPAAGDQFHNVANDSVAKEAVAYRVEKARMGALASEKKASMEDLMARMAQAETSTKELPLIIKGDTQGSVEAIKASVVKLNTDKVKTKIIHSAVGGITETDVVFAKAAGGMIIGFNVRPDRVAAQVAEQDGIEIRCFSIIYELIDSVRLAMAGRLDPIRTEKVLGRAEIRSLFSVPKVGVIAGSFVTDGKVTRNSHVRVVRDGTVIYTGRVSSLKRFKDDAKEVLQGFECGIGVENYNDLKVSDVLESFIIEETAATLD
jgi:translation initiation factor IF-2